MIRCSLCKRAIVKSTRYMDWLKLCDFIEFLFNEQYIEEATRESMMDALMTMKDGAFEDNDDGGSDDTGGRDEQQEENSPSRISGSTP